MNRKYKNSLIILIVIIITNKIINKIIEIVKIIIVKIDTVFLNNLVNLWVCYHRKYLQLYKIYQ